MTVYLTKIMTLLIYPLTWVIGLLLLAWLLQWRQRHRLSQMSLFFGLVLLWIMAMPTTGQWLLWQLEKQYPAQAIADYPTADVIILLGGGLKGAAPPIRPLPEMENAADRIWLAAELYRAGKAPIIIASGGTLDWLGSRQSEATAMKLLLTRFSVPETQIIEEDKSLNTAENAMYSAQICVELSPKRILLVTSASHMPRSIALFKHAFPHAEIIAASTDVRVTTIGDHLLDWLPQASAFELFNPAWHEWMGIWVAKLRHQIE